MPSIIETMRLLQKGRIFLCARHAIPARLFDGHQRAFHYARCDTPRGIGSRHEKTTQLSLRRLCLRCAPRRNFLGCIFNNFPHYTITLYLMQGFLNTGISCICIFDARFMGIAFFILTKTLKKHCESIYIQKTV